MGPRPDDPAPAAREHAGASERAPLARRPAPAPPPPPPLSRPRPPPGPTAGIYRGTAGANLTCGWRFVNSSAGLERTNATAAMASSGFEFAHSVRALASDHAPDHETLWAGIGIQKALGPAKAVRRGEIGRAHV